MLCKTERTRRARILYVGNNTAPSFDHRIVYANASKKYNISFALPEKPEGIPADNFIKLSFKEGLRLFDLYNFLKLFFVLARNSKSYDIIHYLSTKLILFGPFISGLFSMPTIITLTGLGRSFSEKSVKYKFARRIYLLIMKISFLFVHKVLFQNYGHKEWLSKLFPDQKHKFRYVGSAVSFPLVKSKNFKTRKLRILLVTRLMPSKGVRDFLSVAKALYKDDFEFILVGPPSNGFAALLARVLDYSSKEIIQYKGALNTEPLISEYLRAHIFYFPSYGEGLARVLLEAGFSRLCPIVYDTVSNRDLIKEGGGFIINSENSDEVISVLRDLANNREALESNASLYQEYITANFSIGAYARRMDDVIEDVLSKSQ